LEFGKLGAHHFENGFGKCRVCHLLPPRRRLLHCGGYLREHWRARGARPHQYADRSVENSNLRAQLPPGNWPDNQRDIGTVDHQSLNLPIEGLRTPAGAIAGVRTRRIVALVFDLVFVSILSFALWLALAVLTFGLSLFILPPLFPIVAFFYNGLTVSGYKMATPGMRVMDLKMRLTDSARVPFLNAAVHAVLFYVSTMFPPVFLVSLLSADKRCLHDMLAGVVVTRRFM
jgi:uncharacterized RDD family membrane protein YckC